MNALRTQKNAMVDLPRYNQMNQALVEEQGRVRGLEAQLQERSTETAKMLTGNKKPKKYESFMNQMLCFMNGPCSQY